MRTFVTLRRLSVVCLVAVLLTIPAGFAFADEASAAEAQEDTSSVNVFVEVWDWFMGWADRDQDKEVGSRIDPMG